MPMRLLTPWLLLALSLSVAVMVYAAGQGERTLTLAAAASLAAAVILAALWINVPLWPRRGRSFEQALVKTVTAGNVWLAALVYAWGSSALFAVYSLAELAWRHAWQYGLGTAVFALGLALYGHRLEHKADAALPPLALTGLHGFAAAAGLVYLVASGKLSTLRPDWAANQVFLAGGLAVVALCAMAAITQIRNTPPS
jgi:hypothetical protein